MNPEDIIQKLRLERHPEGGWFRRTYQSEESIHLDRGKRFASTSIYYLLATREHAGLHMLSSDETWFFHAGCGLLVHLFGETRYQTKRLGAKLLQGEEPQFTIPSGTVFGAELVRPEAWCLVSCSVCPGFEYSDFSWADTKALLERFPERRELIHLLKP